MPPGSRPAPEGKSAGAAAPDRALVSTHAGVVSIDPESASVVVHEEDDGIFFEAGLVEEVEEAPDVLVEVGEHAKKVGRVPVDFAVVGRAVFVRDDDRFVGVVGGNIAEERLFVFCTFADPAHGLAVEDIGAVALAGFGLSIAQQFGVVVIFL